MTISSSINRVSYTGNNSTVAFAFGQKFFQPADIVFLVVDNVTGDFTRLNYGSDYTISGTQDENGAYPSGAEFTANVAPATGTTVILFRNPLPVQTEVHEDNDPLPAASIDDPLDLLTCLVIRALELNSRSVVLPDSDPAGLTTVLPNAQTRANQLIAFDGSGNLITVADATQGPAGPQGPSGSIPMQIASGSSDAITATYVPAITLADMQLCAFRASSANTTTTPTFSPNGLTAHHITKQGGQPLTAGDIPNARAVCILEFDLANTRWELLNPASSSSTSATTGDLKPTWKATPDSGWIMADDGTIGNASSSASNRANADTANLFSLLWTNFADSLAPVSGGRGSSATSDFTASKTINLPLVLGRVLGVAGSGTGLTTRVLGSRFGEENHQLTDAENGPHTHTAAVNENPHAHTYTQYQATGGGLSAANAVAANAGSSLTDTSLTGITVTLSSSGSGNGHNTMQPTSFMNVMVKL